MKTRDITKVLVVEDDADWREALCQMYKEIVPRCHVDSASSGRDALRRIDNGDKFNLLSLDINLGTTHPKTEVGHPNLNTLGADGRSVLHRAHEEHSCNGVIVITGLAYDTTLAFVIPEEEELKRVKMTLHAYMENLFPHRNLYLQKIAGCSAIDGVSLIKKNLKREELLSLCAVLLGLPPPYTIESSGDYNKPNILIRSKSGNKSITKIEDARFLFHLCDVTKTTKPYVEKKLFAQFIEK